MTSGPGVWVWVRLGLGQVGFGSGWVWVKLGSGQVGFRSGWVRLEFGILTDLASMSGLLHQLIFHVQDLVTGRGQVVRSDGKTSGEARDQ